VDEHIGELFLMDEKPTVEDLVGAIRRATIANTFVPVFMGSAFKNKGVQPLLDAVVDFLPCPTDVENVALKAKPKDGSEAAAAAAAPAPTAGSSAPAKAEVPEEAKVPLKSDSTAPLVALAFKLQESRFGQLT
jgi:elongation factor G